MGTKLVVCVRTDLKMGKGKLAAQVGHASVSAALWARDNAPPVYRAWMASGQPKVVVKLDGIDHLEEIERAARNAKLHTEAISDAGRTQLDPGTTTCLAVGPEEEGKVDTVTGHLKLL